MTASLDLETRGGPRGLAAFARLYRETLGLVRAMLVRLGVPEAAVDDATQDVYVAMYRNRDRFDAGRPVEPWLVGISRRVAFRHRRSHARRQRAHAALAWAHDAATSPSAAPRVEARQFLERFIDELSEDRRQVFVLGELHGMTGPELAQRLGIPVDTAYTRLRATRIQLSRALLAATADEPPVEPRETRRCWLLLAPRLIDAPTPVGWLLTTLARTEVIVATLVIAAVAAVVAVAKAPPPRDPIAAAPTPPPRPAPIPPPTSDTPEISLPPPPPGSRFTALLAPRSAPAALSPSVVAPAIASPRTRDPLGAALMRAAVEALAAGDPTTALALVDRHAREHPDSALAPTRPLTRIRSLCQLGRVREARDEAARLRARDPVLAQDNLAATCAADP